MSAAFRPSFALPVLASLCLMVPASAAGAQAIGPDEGIAQTQAYASSARTGGASADSAAGGIADPGRSGALSYGTPAPQRPVARVFRLSPAKVVAGSPVRVRVRVDERGVKRVAARIVALDARTRAVGGRLDLGRIATGRVVTVRWPAASAPAAGTWTVRLHVKDPQGATLARAATASGKATLEVQPRPRPENPQPEPQPQAQPTAPVQSTGPVVAGGVFPVQGPHSFGGDDARFGAGRTGHRHQGQDVLAGEGVPVVAPVAGTIAYSDYQAKGAGYYIVQTADDGRTFFYAHCQQGSVSVTAGQRVTAGQAICRVGHTGDATGPHLHFEIWIGGWRDKGGQPVDPLAQLQAWDAQR